MGGEGGGGGRNETTKGIHTGPACQPDHLVG